MSYHSHQKENNTTWK